MQDPKIIIVALEGLEVIIAPPPFLAPAPPGCSSSCCGSPPSSSSFLLLLPLQLLLGLFPASLFFPATLRPWRLTLALCLAGTSEYQNILKIGDAEAKHMGTDNMMVQIVEQSNGAANIEQLQHHENEDIYNKVCGSLPSHAPSLACTHTPSLTYMHTHTHTHTTLYTHAH